jgi:hypothetical protein
VSGEWVRLRKLELHNWKDRVELGVAWRTHRCPQPLQP